MLKKYMKRSVVILFVIQDDHILNLLEGVIKTKTYMKKGLLIFLLLHLNKIEALVI